MEKIINDLKIDVKYCKKDILDVFLPILKKVKASNKEKVIIALAGAPGSGKSVLASLIEETFEEVQVVGLDGFHYFEQYLLDHDLKKRKGASFTFDVLKLEKKILEYLKGPSFWPVYSRSLHDVVDDRIHVTKNVLLIEGNYLLMDEYPWSNLFKYYDCTIFLKTDADLKKRIIKRKEKGKITAELALENYLNNDDLNIRDVFSKSIEADFVVYYDGHYTIDKTSNKS